jgi:hypothetical protein
MNDLDPQLMRLREVEARLAFAEFHVHDQEALVLDMRERGFDTRLAQETLEAMLAALEIFRRRQADILGAMERGHAGSQPPP